LSKSAVSRVVSRLKEHFAQRKARDLCALVPFGEGPRLPRPQSARVDHC
jgi:hypothetical protein